MHAVVAVDEALMVLQCRRVEVFICSGIGADSLQVRQSLKAELREKARSVLRIFGDGRTRAPDSPGVHIAVLLAGWNIVKV